VKDVAQGVVQGAAQDVAQDLTQDVAEDVLGTAGDGSMKFRIAARAFFERRNPRQTQACRPHSAFWQLVNSRHVKDAA